MAIIGVVTIPDGVNKKGTLINYTSMGLEGTPPEEFGMVGRL